jgi:hypothetical protein
MIHPNISNRKEHMIDMCKDYIFIPLYGFYLEKQVRHTQSREKLPLSSGETVDPWKSAVLD